MKTNLVGIMAVLTLVLGTTASIAQAAEEDATLTTQAAQMDRYATAKGQTTVSSRTAADFSKFYGQTNSQALAEGLRSGSEITLATTAADGTTSTATFTPPTGSMGNGNVYISMALAQQQLTAAGITDPTAQQIETAMVGGTLTPGGEPVEGVLEMRASGMGWGQIAQAYGTKLGPVISGMKAANTALSRTTVKPGTTTTTTGSTPATAAGKATAAKPKATTGTGKSGIVTGAGGANVVGGAKASGGKSGIVTGAGGAAGTGAGGVSSAGGGAKSQGQGTGIVTGGGAAGGAAGGSGGQGKGYGKGGK